MLTRTTVVVLWAWWTACTFRAVPDVAACERCALPHVAAHERYAALHVVPGGLYAALHVAPLARCAAQRAGFHAVPYRTLVECLGRLVLEQLVLERPAVPEPQHLTPLAWWSAAQIPTRRPVREGKMRLDARSVVHSCCRPPRNLPRNNHERLLKMNAR